MKAKVRKWGNSASVRIPAAVLQAANLELDEDVDVWEDGGRIIIEPVRSRSYNLQALLDGITEDNRHDAIDTGDPAGNEIW